jgi:hypothetical protein
MAMKGDPRVRGMAERPETGFPSGLQAEFARQFARQSDPKTTGFHRIQPE